MEKIRLSPQNYNALKKIDLNEMEDSIQLIDEENSFTTSNIGLLEIILSELIGMKWITDDPVLNEEGRELESLYDEIYFFENN